MAKPIVSAERLREFLIYDTSSPSGLRWKIDRNATVLSGRAAGTLFTDKRGDSRWVLTAGGRSWQAHRVVWMMFHGEIPDGLVVDHIDGCATNNSIGNLRVVSIAINSRNQGRMVRNKTGALGVSRDFHNKQYVASWYEDGRKLRQKRFSIKKYGEDVAFSLAKEFRIQMMNALQGMGAGYTERHLSRSM